MKTLLCLLFLCCQPADANLWIPDYVPVSTRIANAIPTVKVYRTADRPIAVISSKLPCEAISGGHSPPGDVIRFIINAVIEKFNDAHIVDFDITVVCE